MNNSSNGSNEQQMVNNMSPVQLEPSINCPKCGTVVKGKFCASCGTKIEALMPQQTVSSVQPMMQPVQQVPMQQQNNNQNIPGVVPGINEVQQTNKTPKKSKKGLIAIIVAVILVVVAGIVAVMLILNNDDKEKTSDNNEEIKEESKTEVHEKVKRTIMIYMVGSNLESESSIATYDLEDINPSRIDLENMNIIMIAGGSKKWYNDYIDEEETAIFELTEDGFEKMKVYDVKNMGDSKTLSDFLTHAYTYYPAEQYDLIFWNHGSAVYGLENDEISEDSISLAELEFALKSSPFNSSNKLETVIFRTCLMGSFEVADILNEYANYMVGAEELTIGHKYVNVFTFFEQIDIDDNGIDVGKKFIDTYYKSIDEYNSIRVESGYPADNVDITYSVVDLSKTDELKQNLYDFFNDINVSSNYQYIAYIRANLDSYGKDSKNVFEMVDLYELVEGLSVLSPTKGEALLQSIRTAVVYNKVNNDYSNGLSIYFPYNGSSDVRSLLLGEIKKISNSNSNNYLSFISNFNSVLDAGYNSSQFSVLNNTMTSKKGTFSLKLTEEQQKNYSKAKIMVFEDMGDGYYMPLYTSSDVTLDKNGNLVAPYNGKALSVIDKEDNSESVILLIEEEKTANYTKYSTPVYFESVDKETLDWKIDYATMYIVVDKNNPNGAITSIVKDDLNETLPSIVLLEMEDYQNIYYMNFKYKILDENGNYTTDWESAGVSYLFRTRTDKTKYEYKIANLDNGSKYYAVFGVYDIYNKLSYSKLIPLS